MATIPSFDVPDEALQALGLTPEQFASELRLAAAAIWYDRGMISQGIGARIAGLDRWEFMLGLSRHQVSPMQETVEEIQQVLERGRAAGSEYVPAHHPRAGGDG
jgi:predicted HTH domain antitoxin